MTPKTEEQLSALMDAELSEFERRRMLATVVGDRAGMQRLGRYQLIGEVIRSEGDVPPVRPEFAEAVSLRLQSEAPISVPVRIGKPSGRFTRAASGLALAASVAAMAVYMAPRYLSSAADESSNMAAVEIAAAAAPASGNSNRSFPTHGTHWDAVNPEVQRKLNRYLVNHGEYTSGNGVNRVVPYAAFVSYDLGR